MKSQSADPIWIIRLVRDVKGIRSQITQHVQGPHTLIEVYAEQVMPGWVVVHVERDTR